MTAVLMHHGFAPSRRTDDPENLFVPEASLVAQLDYLGERGWEALSLQDYLDGTVKAGRRSYLLTVDDGLASAGDIAAPVLAERKVPWVLFVPAGLVGATASWLALPANEPILGAAQLRELASTGVEIGGHGWEHRAMVGLSSSELRRQTADVRDHLSELVGKRPRAFAYPYGAFDASAQAAVAAADYEVAFSVFDDGGRFAASRVDVNATDSLTSFRIKLIPGYRRVWRWSGRLGPLRRAARRVLTSQSRPDAQTG